MADEFAAKQLDNFYKAASSLKLFSRAELNDEKNRSQIEKLYVDPLPNEQAFKTLLGDSTTIIVGRKGTGKSTVFQRVQHEIRKKKSNIISAYMDIRNVYESSQIDQIEPERVEQLATAMSPTQMRKFLLYKRFFRTLINDIQFELRTQVEQSFLSRLRERVRGSAAEVFKGLDAIVARIDKPEYENIGGFVAVSNTSKELKKAKRVISANAGLSASVLKADISTSAKVGLEATNEQSGDLEQSYVQLLMRIVGVNEIIAEIKMILAALGIRYLYVFLDDFSELPEEPMRLLVDSLISPLTR